MGNKEAKSAGASVTSKGLVAYQEMNFKRIQNVLLIWVDKNIHDDSDDCKNTISQLRQVVNDINKFIDGEQCIEFLESIQDNKACMIISGSLGQHIVPRVHNMSQVDSIFIFCGNKEYHERWAKKWSKIKGVFTQITLICEAVKEAAQQCEQNAISISLMTTGDDLSEKNLNQLEPGFMYSQIIREILLTIQFEEKQMEQFIDYCRKAFAGNPSELENVDQLQMKYFQKTPIWWYTYEGFLYKMLNHALRTLNADLIIKLGFFIKDLHLQIEKLHKEQFNGHISNKQFTVYRGQGMEKEEFEKVMQTKGGLLSFNCFLSTSEARDVSTRFAERAAKNPQLVGILFVMTIDPSQSTTPFAAIGEVGCYKNQEEEVLFSMHTVFRINDITSMDENHRLFQVELTLTNDNDPNLRILTDRIREETFPNSTGWYRLGEVLYKMGQFKKAEEVYGILLATATTEIEKAFIYNQIASYKKQLGEYKEAIIYYEKVLAFDQQSLPANHPDLASSYNNIGGVYESMGDYPKALSYCEKALKIQQQSLPVNHPDLFYYYNNIGGVYKSMGDYPKALSFYEKSLAIQQQSLPPNHPDFARCYIWIGDTYDSMGEYSEALSFYEKSLAIQQQSLLPNHPDLAASYNNIGMAYCKMGEYSKAYPFYEQAVKIVRQSLPANHYNVKTFESNLKKLKILLRIGRLFSFSSNKK